MDLTTKLRAACGHDSRSVDGCTNCEAADEIERLRTHAVVLAATAEEVERERSARIVEAVHGWEGVRDVAARIRAAQRLS